MFLKRSFVIALSVFIVMFIAACGSSTTSGGGPLWRQYQSTCNHSPNDRRQQFLRCDSNGNRHRKRRNYCMRFLMNTVTNLFLS